MTDLHLTQEALAELAAQDQLGFGSHLLPDVQTGVPGLVLGVLDYNPRRDSVRDIVHTSIQEMVSGNPQVRQYAPYQRLDINFVIHEPASTDVYGIPEAKRQLASVLFNTVVESLPGITDYVHQYRVGALAVRKAHTDYQAITTNGSPEADAAAVANITRRGLTFVVSDFMDLPLEKLKTKDFPATIGLKVNHPMEIKLSTAKVGRIATTGSGEVNTNKPKEVQRFNEALTRTHSSIIERLGKVGIAVAQITLDPSRKNGLLYGLADIEISRAIAQVY